MSLYFRKTSQYGLPVSIRKPTYTKYLLILSFCIIIVAIYAVFILTSVFPEEKKYGEGWCKLLLAQHDPNVMKMSFDAKVDRIYVTKTNATLYFTPEKFVAEMITIYMKNGTVEECSMQVLSNAENTILGPVRAYTCPNETSYMIASGQKDGYFYAGTGNVFSLSSPMMKEAFAEINFTRELHGFAYIYYINYYRPDQGRSYEEDLAENREIEKICRVNA